MKEDVQNASINLTVSIGNMKKKKLHCQHRQYEEEKLHWLV
jgi:hypothetical protein